MEVELGEEACPMELINHWDWELVLTGRTI
jgi:hypothetical protein